MALETEGLKLDMRVLRKGVKKIIQSPSVGNYWIVENSKKERLCVCLNLFEWSDWRNRNVLWIHSLYVSPEFRKLGAYKELYKFLQNKVKSSKNLGGIRLYVDKRNQVAQKVYKNLGMSNEHYDLFEWLK
jgi:RimJ/RimL family protein N-acetyltransferase